MLNFTFTLPLQVPNFFNLSSRRLETAVTAGPPPTAHRRHRPVAHCPPPAGCLHAPIAACTAARLTPQSLPARLHASRPHATHSGTIATGVNYYRTRALPFFLQATVSTSILPTCNSAAPQQPAVPKRPTPVSSRQWEIHLA